jgi:hypothetical protein
MSPLDSYFNHSSTVLLIINIRGLHKILVKKKKRKDLNV